MQSPAITALLVGQISNDLYLPVDQIKTVSRVWLRDCF